MRSERLLYRRTVCKDRGYNNTNTSSDSCRDETAQRIHKITNAYREINIYINQLYFTAAALLAYYMLLLCLCGKHFYRPLQPDFIDRSRTTAFRLAVRLKSWEVEGLVRVPFGKFISFSPPSSAPIPGERIAIATRLVRAMAARAVAARGRPLKLPK